MGIIFPVDWKSILLPSSTTSIFLVSMCWCHDLKSSTVIIRSILGFSSEQILRCHDSEAYLWTFGRMTLHRPSTVAWVVQPQPCEALSTNLGFSEQLILICYVLSRETLERIDLSFRQSTVLWWEEAISVETTTPISTVEWKMLLWKLTSWLPPKHNMATRLPRFQPTRGLTSIRYPASRKYLYFRNHTCAKRNLHLHLHQVQGPQ
jgi:hypothetical protein